jgi:SAM-dependent methyltransferase
MSVAPPQTSVFYTTAQGALVARLLRQRLLRLCPPRPGLAVLGIGHPFPYLRPYLSPGQRPASVAVTLAQAGAVPWPAEAAGLSCTAEEDSLPFADLSFDRVLIVHGLEAAEAPRRLLREVWRVLRDDGRLIVVAPNRRGLWAFADSTPFGQGQPFSPSQITRLLSESMFHIERRDTALFVPPLQWRLVMRGARAWERTGRALAPQLAGVTLTEAIKDSYAAIGMPAKARMRRRYVMVPSS